MLGRDNASLSKILRYQFSSDKEMYNELYKLMGGNKIPATNAGIGITKNKKLLLLPKKHE